MHVSGTAAFFGTVLPVPESDRAAAETGALLLREHGLNAAVTPDNLLQVCDGRGVVVLLRVTPRAGERVMGARFVLAVWHILDTITRAT